MGSFTCKDIRRRTVMDLSQVQKNEKVKIIRINAQTTLKKRLASLGVSVGKEIEVLETTLQKNTIYWF